MNKFILISGLIWVLILFSIKNLYSQNNNGYVFTINENQNCAQSIELFKSKYEVLVGYNPNLVEILNTSARTIKGNSISALFEKLCSVYNLEFIATNTGSFLVRSDSNLIEASEEVVIHINISESRDGLPVSYAAVYDPSKKYFAFTDEFGDCFIKLPKDMVGTPLLVHSLAHTEMEVSTSLSRNFHKIKLQDAPVDALPLVISSLKRKLNFNKQQGIFIDNTLHKKMGLSSILTGDLSKTVQMLPGVNGINDSKSSVRIRGANDEATLLILDNMPIYKADHFYGIFGAFNSFFINDFSLHKNNIPVEYGGRTSGMLKMNSLGHKDSFNLDADINLLNTGLTVSLPVSKYFSWTFAARKTYTDLLKTPLYDLSQRDNISTEPKNKVVQNLIISKPSFDFYDINSRVSFKKSNHSLDANVFVSSDIFKDNYTTSFKINNQATSDEIFSQNNKWANHSFGLNYGHENNIVDLVANIYHTAYQVSYDITSDLKRREPSGWVRDTANIFNNNEIADTGGKFLLNFKKLSNLKFGAEYIVHNNLLFIENDRRTIFEVNRRGVESAIFSSVDLGKKDGWLVVPALRVTHLGGLQKNFFLPQLFTSYAIGPSALLKASAGKHMQNVRLFEHENAFGQRQQFFALSNGNSIPLGIGQNYMIGGWWSSGNFTIDVEAYFRLLDGAITHATNVPGLRPLPGSNISFPAFRLFTGESKVQGIDFTLLYEIKRLFSMMSYTLSKADNRYPEIFNNRYFPSSEDSRHQFKWINTFTVNKFEFSLNYFGATGRPYLDLSNLDRRVDRRNLDIDKYIKKLADYHRFDLGINYNIYFLKQKAKFGFTIFNVFNRTNVKYRQFVNQIAVGPGGNNQQNTILGADVSQLDRTVNISFILQFN